MKQQLAERLKRPFQYHDSVGSTNDLARDWLQAGAPVGAVVIADEQRTGRGRMGRQWQTPPGQAIAMSVVLKPPAEFASRVSLMAALCIAEVCEALNITDVGIKWPNDVQIQGRKLSGVLPEAVWQDDKLLGVVLGMGINVRVDFDDMLRASAINLEAAYGAPLDRVTVIQAVLTRLDHWSAQIASATLVQAWKTRLVTLGQQVTIGAIRGLAVDVDADGALIVQTADGAQQRVVAGDIA